MNDTTMPETSVPDAAPTHVGTLLCATRMRLGKDLQDIAGVLHIRYNFLVAIEDGRYEDLPGQAYAIGFVRAYADHLGLDGGEVVRRYKEETAGIKRVTRYEYPIPPPESGIPSGALLAIAVVLGMVVYGVWYSMADADRRAADVIQEVPDRLAALLKDESAAPPAETQVAAGEPGEDIMPAPESDDPAPPPADEPAPAPSPAPAAPVAAAPDQKPAAAKPEPPVAPAPQPKVAAAPQAAAPLATAPLATAPQPTGPAATAPVTPPPATGAAPTQPPPKPAPAAAPDKPATAPATQAPATVASVAPAVTSPAMPTAAPAKTATAPLPATPPPATPPPATKPTATTPPAASPSAQPEAVAPKPAAATPTSPQPASAQPAPAQPAPSAPAAAKPTPPAATPAPQTKPPATNPPATNPSAATTTAPAQTASAPATTAPPTKPAAKSAGRVSNIELRAKSDSWIQVRDGEQLLLTRFLRKGEVYKVPDRNGLTLMTLNAGGIEVIVDGDVMPPLGEPGTVARGVVLDGAKLRGQGRPPASSPTPPSPAAPREAPSGDQ